MTFQFKIYVGVKKDTREQAKERGIKYDNNLKKWYIIFDHDQFITNDTLYTYEFKPYAIELLTTMEDEDKYKKEISKLLNYRIKNSLKI